MHVGHTTTQFSGKNYTDANNPYRFAEDFGYAGYVNPYWILANGDGDNKNNMEQTQFAINVMPQYKIGKYLKLSNRFSYIMTRNNEKYYLPHDGTPTTTVAGLGAVSSTLRSQFTKETTLFNDFRIDWKRQFGGHFVNVLGGFRMSSFSYNNSNMVGYNNDQDKMPNMSMSLQYKEAGGTSDKSGLTSLTTSMPTTTTRTSISSTSVQRWKPLHVSVRSSPSCSYRVAAGRDRPRWLGQTAAGPHAGASHANTMATRAISDQ